MRMVSNKHVTSTSMKRFKKVHVQHKEYVAKPVVERVEVKFEERKVHQKYVQRKKNTFPRMLLKAELPKSKRW